MAKISKPNTLILIFIVLILMLSGCQKEPAETTPQVTLPGPNSVTSSDVSPSQTLPVDSPGQSQTAEPTTEQPLAYYTFDPTVTGIFLSRDGEIKSAEVTDFDNTGLQTPRYHATDLQKFVDERVKAYNDAKGNAAISVDTLTVKNNTATLILDYKTIDDFMSFQGSEFGVRVLALLNREDAIRGYDIKNLKDTAGNSVDIMTAFRSADTKVIVISGKTLVTVNGDIICLSDGLIPTGPNSARCDSDQGYSFILFR